MTLQKYLLLVFLLSSKGEILFFFFYAYSVTSRQNFRTFIFNWNASHKLQKNAQCLNSCLICYQLHEKVQLISVILGDIIWVPIAH